MKKKKSTYGLVGYPVEHSLSPCMHNTAFRALNVDAEYKLFPLKAEEVEGFFRDLTDKDNSIFGVNVTVPYKEKVIEYIDSLSPFAEKIMAVNTVVVDKEHDRLIGYNTDGPGFLAHMVDLSFGMSKKRISVIGAGGAARAIVSVLCLVQERPESVRIFDIDSCKAQTLLNDLSTRFDTSIVHVVHSIDDLNIEITDLLINATPVGMKEDDVCFIEPELFHEGMLVYDLIYNPRETQLLKLAAQHGAQIANGLGMLFYQGVLAFQHWADTGLDQSVKEKMRESLEVGEVV